jgi:hypothetical protein
MEDEHDSYNRFIILEFSATYEKKLSMGCKIDYFVDFSNQLYKKEEITLKYP